MTQGQRLRSLSTLVSSLSPTFSRGTSAYNPATNSITGAGVARTKVSPSFGSADTDTLIEGPRTNLLAAGTSERFALWTNVGAATVTDGIAGAPDGTATASTIQDSSAGAYQGVSQTFTVANDSLSHCFTIYVKKTTGGTSGTFGLNIQLSGGTSVGVTPRINTDTGATGVGAGAPYLIESVGNYWRVVGKITNNSLGNTTLGVTAYAATNTYGSVGSDSATGVGTATVYGAMLEKADFPSSYISNRNIQIRTNDQSHAAWTKTAVTVVSGQVAADGNTTACKIQETNTVTTDHLVHNGSKTVVSGATLTFSSRVRQSERTWACLNMYDTVDNRCFYNLAAGTLGTMAAGCTGTITVDSGGYYWISITKTITGTTAFGLVGPATADATFNYTGTTGNGIFIDGSQFEYGSARTTLWTNNTAVGLREADNLSVSLASLPGGGLGTTSGTIVAIVQPYGWTGNAGGAIARILDDTNNTLRTSLWYSAAGVLNAERIDTGGSPTGPGPAGTPSNGVNSVTAMTWSAGQLIPYLGGVAGTPVATVTQPWLATTNITIGATAGGTLPVYGWVRFYYFHNRALTPDEVRTFNDGLPK